MNTIILPVHLLRRLAAPTSSALAAVREAKWRSMSCSIEKGRREPMGLFHHFNSRGFAATFGAGAGPIWQPWRRSPSRAPREGRAAGELGARRRISKLLRFEPSAATARRRRGVSSTSVQIRREYRPSESRSNAALAAALLRPYHSADHPLLQRREAIRWTGKIGVAVCLHPSTDRRSKREKKVTPDFDERGSDTSEAEPHYISKLSLPAFRYLLY
jgi:hypothetical protein